MPVAYRIGNNQWIVLTPNLVYIHTRNSFSSVESNEADKNIGGLG